MNRNDPNLVMLLEECRRSPPDLQDYLAKQFAALMAASDFLEALPCFLPPDSASQLRLPELEQTLRSLMNICPS